MTRISATKAGASSQRDASGLLDEVIRRASHEVKNALNAVAVNIEVVRSRLAQAESGPSRVGVFAERASAASDLAASLGSGLADLARLIMRASVHGKLDVVPGTDHPQSVAIQVHSSDIVEISQDLRALAERTGIAIRLDGTTVIFTVRD